ncbi:DUF368 domain-containing protein [Patiriisocius marinistellae]|uniref:DUF368 domain-containing protein n=1 Tax=Patiriisocius marinistellae TaxID=2494560 RepID=A0A5J4FXI5_9FLAO|nr:DUF368 domain-containing protein [Patiriisocius marinistellae]GEQ85862.1 DUF368 domain-containing protein [Patiriisocius marinistellae]
MPSRTLLQSLTLFAKGLAMGAADVVPGVSGGTIAFISGIYEELIETIHNLNFSFFKIWKKEGLKAAWVTFNLGFLVTLFGGVAVSIISLAKLITWLLATYPVLVWAFFFGLVVASILYVGKQITRFSLSVLIAVFIAAALSYYITLAEPIGNTDSTWFLFLAGFIAIIAMILPGISGAFILLLLGAYTSVIGTISSFSEGILRVDFGQVSNAFLKLITFGIGAIAGLKVFSGVLNWMFKHYKNITLAILTGFMIGALNKIWPWKEVLKYRVNSHGEEIPFLERSILPANYDGDPQIIAAIICTIFGFACIYFLEFTATKKNSKQEIN